MTATSTAVFNKRPVPTSSVIAVMVVVGSVALLASEASQRRLLAVALVGLVVFAGGGRQISRNRAVGGSLLTGGTAVILWALGQALTQLSLFTHRLELLAGVLGLWLFVSALAPTNVRWRRQLLSVGVGLLFGAVFISGVLNGSSLPAIVLSAAGLFLAWDTAENAISLGGQIGAAESTASRRAEAVHIGATSVVACVAVGAVLGIWRLGIEGIPLVGLFALLVASIALALSAYQ